MLVAIVDDQPGVTRDRNFAAADWAGRHFFIVDTGGVIEGSDEPIIDWNQNKIYSSELKSMSDYNKSSYKNCYK